MSEPSELSWDDYRFFHEVARAGSIRAAARALAVDHATVSRRLAGLEAAFSVKLLVRGADGVRLTLAGEELGRAAASVRSELLSVERKITGADLPLAGRIRVSTHAVLGTRFIVPSIAGFCERKWPNGVHHCRSARATRLRHAHAPTPCLSPRSSESRPHRRSLCVATTA